MSLPRAAIKLLRADTYRRVRWRNGAGWTREIACEPDSDAFDWRLSVAEIEQNSAFSSFPGIERHLVLLTGNGMRLRLGTGATQMLLPPQAGMRFSGDDEVACELLDGPTTDFNLMWRRGRVDAQLWHRPLVGSLVIFVNPHEIWALYLRAGRARLKGNVPHDVEPGDTVLLRAGKQRSCCNVDGAGEALLIRIAPIVSIDAFVGQNLLHDSRLS